MKNITKEQIYITLSEHFDYLEETLGKENFDRKHYYFAGGCIYSMWHDREPKDYDIFCTSRSAMNKLVRHFDTHPELYNIKTENAYSMGKYQFIIKHVGKPEKEVAEFDFKHNCYWCDSADVHAIHDWSYIDSNKLEFNSERARDVLNIITRIPKFMSRGMEISQAEILNILEVGTRFSKVFGERRNIIKRKRGRSVY